jgi:hypothetical protein
MEIESTLQEELLTIKKRAYYWTQKRSATCMKRMTVYIHGHTNTYVPMYLHTYVWCKIEANFLWFPE